MKIHQFRYPLFLLLLIFIGVTSLVYSQEVPEQSNGELVSVEQSSKTPDPVLQNSLDNSFWTYVIIFGAFIVLGLAVAVFLGFRKIQQQQTKVENSEQGWRDKLNSSEQHWEEQLERIRRQGKDSTEKLEEIVSDHSHIRNEQKDFQNTLSELGNRLDSLELILENLDLDKVPDKTVDKQPQLEEIIQEARTQVESLVQTYENGEPIDYVEIEDPTPSQITLHLLNWIVRSIGDWKDDLEQSGTANPDLIQTLVYASQAMKDKLKEIRGPAPLLPEPPEVETDVNTDTAYNEFQNECVAYVSRYEGVLIGLQLGCKIDEKEYDQFIPQFVKDRLFNSIARFVKFDQLPEQLDEYLQLVGYEVVPIEIGKTQADARIHDIQSSQQTNAEPGTVAEVILPGLQRIDNSETVQKPIVVRGE